MNRGNGLGPVSVCERCFGSELREETEGSSGGERAREVGVAFAKTQRMAAHLVLLLSSLELARLAQPLTAASVSAPGVPSTVTSAGNPVQAAPSGESPARAEVPAWIKEGTEVFAPRLALGVGWGSPGTLGGSLNAGLDLGVFRHLAVGFEFVSAGGADVDLLDLYGDSLGGIHLRLVGRYYFFRDRLLITSGVAVGPGWYDATNVSRCSDADVGGSNTYCTYEGPGAVSGIGLRHGNGLGYALEVSASMKLRKVRLGIVARGDAVNNDVGTLTFGPMFALSI